MVVTSYLSNRNWLTPRPCFVTIRVTPDKFVCVGRYAICRKCDTLPLFHMYKFIIKTTKYVILL